MVDPADPIEVGDGLLDYLRRELGDDHLTFLAAPTSAGDGMSTFIWFFQLRGSALRNAWSAPLVLRLHAHQNEVEVNDREAAVQRFVAERGYPAPDPLVVCSDLDPATNPFELPFTIMPRAPGRLVLRQVTARPGAAPSLLRRMAGLQLRLHALPLEGCPLPYDRPLVDSLLERLERMQTEGGWADLAPTLEWLRAHAEVVRDERPVLGHNDFHPLNIMVADDGRMTVIDWTDAAIGDRHYDVARSLVLFWVASIAADTAAERIALRSARSTLARIYRTAYEKGYALDDRRLTYWQVVHLFRGQMQVLELHQPSGPDRSRTAAAQQIPLDLASRLGERVTRLQDGFKRR